MLDPSVLLLSFLALSIALVILMDVVLSFLSSATTGLILATKCGTHSDNACVAALNANSQQESFLRKTLIPGVTTAYPTTEMRPPDYMVYLRA